MSVLSDAEILSRVESGEIVIDPCDPEMFRPSSVDLRLGEEILVPEWEDGVRVADAKDAARRVRKVSIGDGHILAPGAFVLSSTRERLRVPETCQAVIRNRNSLAAIGLDVAAGCHLNPGYEGTMPLVIRNIGPKAIVIAAGDPVCQIVFHTLGSRAARGYAQQTDTEALLAIARRWPVGKDGSSFGNSEIAMAIKQSINGEQE